VRYAVASSATGATITPRVRRDPSGRSITAEFADDGPGFTPGARPRGHGVGLESVRERLRLGGEGHAFSVETALGQGTRVRVTLPLEPAPAAVALPLPGSPGSDDACVANRLPTAEAGS